jgi:hypothetical protein
MSAATKPKYWTEAAVYERLRHVFPGPAYVRLPQVRNGTGCGRSQTRTADAVIASVWPSRGLWLAGVEIKVSRADWKKELAHAEKSVGIQKYCKHWYVAAPAGVVPVAEVPDAWGLIEVKANTASIEKASPQLEAVPVDLLLVCSILRTVSECTVSTDSVKEQVSERVESARKTWEAQAGHEMEHLQKAVREFEAASGIEISSRWYNREIGEAVAFVRKTGIIGAVRVAEDLRERAAAVVKGLDEALVQLRSQDKEPTP